MVHEEEDPQLQNDPPNCPKKGTWPVAWYFNRPPESVFVIARHLANHRKDVPKGPFQAKAVGRTEGGWSVVDLGEQGWYGPSCIPHHKPIPWRGDLSCLLHQPLGHEWSLRSAFALLKSCGRITKAQYDEAKAWLDEERRLFSLQTRIREATELLQENGYSVTRDE